MSSLMVLQHHVPAALLPSDAPKALLLHPKTCKTQLWQPLLGEGTSLAGYDQPSCYFRPFELESHRKRTITPSGCGGTVWGPKPGPALRGQTSSLRAGHKPPCAHRDGDGPPGAGRRLEWLPSDGEVPAFHSYESSVPLGTTSNRGLSSSSTKSPEATGC